MGEVRPRGLPLQHRRRPTRRAPRAHGLRRVREQAGRHRPLHDVRAAGRRRGLPRPVAGRRRPEAGQEDVRARLLRDDRHAHAPAGPVPSSPEGRAVRPAREVPGPALRPVGRVRGGEAGSVHRRRGRVPALRHGRLHRDAQHVGGHHPRQRAPGPPPRPLGEREPQPHARRRPRLDGARRTRELRVRPRRLQGSHHARGGDLLRELRHAQGQAIVGQVIVGQSALYKRGDSGRTKPGQ